MRRLTALCVTALLATAGISIAPAETAPAANLLTAEGYGGVTVGMGKDAALKILGTGWKYEAFEEGGADVANDVCGSIYREAEGADISFLTIGGKVARAEAGTEKVATEKGIHIGSTEDDVRKAYGKDVSASPNQYEEAPAAYLTVWTKGGPKKPDDFVEDKNARGIRFTTGADKKVNAIYGGDDTIQYVEGCA